MEIGSRHRSCASHLTVTPRFSDNLRIPVYDNFLGIYPFIHALFIIIWFFLCKEIYAFVAKFAFVPSSNG